MGREPRAFLWDAREGAIAIAEFTAGRRFDDYVADRMLRSAPATSTQTPMTSAPVQSMPSSALA